MATPSRSSEFWKDEFRPRRTPLGRFVFDWINYQRFTAIKQRWNDNERPIQDHHLPFLNWSWMNSHHVTVRVGERIKDLIQAKLDCGSEHEWHFYHPLGHGGFGAVAAFTRRDMQTGAIKDQVVAKTTRARATEAVDRTRPDLSKEAAIMAQTNDCNKDGMLVLRNYKHYQSPNESQWKYYFEYCQYGDLERLITRYKAYGRYFPELFLWHLFYWLAKTTHEYAGANMWQPDDIENWGGTNMWRDLDLENWGAHMPTGYLLHCDIKPQNIFLGPPDDSQTDDDISLYPIPRIADLGLAEITSQDDIFNCAFYFEKGTRSWIPPECRTRQTNPRTPFYPFGTRLKYDTREAHRKAYHRVTSRANIWAIGSVMFSMMTLKGPDFISERVNAILSERAPLPRPEYGENLIDESDFEIHRLKYYSKTLQNLIVSCLHIKPEDRPAEDELLRQAKAGYETFLQHIRDEANSKSAAQGGVAPDLATVIDNSPEHKLYFVRNTIDSAPDNYQFDHDRNRDFWTHTFVEDFPWIPPDWGKLWPECMPIDTRPPSHWPPGLRSALENTRDQIKNLRLYQRVASRSEYKNSDIYTPGTYFPGRMLVLTRPGDRPPNIPGGNGANIGGDHDGSDDASYETDDTGAQDTRCEESYLQSNGQQQHQNHQQNGRGTPRPPPQARQPRPQNPRPQSQQRARQPRNRIVDLLGLRGQPGYDESSSRANNDDDDDDDEDEYEDDADDSNPSPPAIGRSSGPMSGVAQQLPTNTYANPPFTNFNVNNVNDLRNMYPPPPGWEWDHMLTQPVAQNPAAAAAAMNPLTAPGLYAPAGPELAHTPGLGGFGAAFRVMNMGGGGGIDGDDSGNRGDQPGVVRTARNPNRVVPYPQAGRRGRRQGQGQGQGRDGGRWW